MRGEEDSAPRAAGATIPQILAARARAHPDRAAFVHLPRGEGPGAAVAYAALLARAGAAAGWLRARLPAGAPVALILPNTPDHVDIALGCLIAGLPIVPLAPPRGAAGRARTARLIAAAGARLVVVAPGRQADLAELAGPGGVVAADAIPRSGAAPVGPAPAPGDTAVLQLTSGSTGDPKAVEVRHANLAANCAALAGALGAEEDLRIAGWLPFFHDWGLVGCLFFPVFAGGTCIYFDPADFLASPMRWPRALSAHRATVGCAPDFAYDLCAELAAPADIAALDLATWRRAMVGAEPVRARTLARFAAAFAPAGFDEAAFYPSYGLAEATLIVTGGRATPAPRQLTLAAAALAAGRADAAAPGAPAPRRLVSCGRALPGTALAIADAAAGAPLPEGRVGEVWVQGPGVAAGYRGDRAGTAASFGARLAGQPGTWLRTGDLGFLRDGELYVCGRAKDVIIRGGHNHMAEDLEAAAAGCHPGLRPGCCAAFATEIGGREALVMAQEVAFGPRPDLPAAARALRNAVLAGAGIGPDVVALVAAGSLEKTSSGKMRRQAARARFEAGTLAPLYRLGRVEPHQA